MVIEARTIVGAAGALAVAGLALWAGLPAIAHAQKLLNEHEMGELFKVIGFAKGCDAGFTTAPIGFEHGDRTHTL